MSEANLVGAFALSVAVTAVACPLAIRLAYRLRLYDVPTGWKEHSSPTPYLGGLAVLAGFVVATLLLGGDIGRFGPIVATAAFLCVVGILDDRFGIPPLPRVGAEVLAGVALWASGLAWPLFDNDLADLCLNVVWVLGVVNGLNLLDLMDGTAGSAAAACAAGVAAIAGVDGDLELAAVALSVAGGCLAFLPYNLSSPSRVFLGDGGSMPLGFLLAALIAGLPAMDSADSGSLAIAALLFGFPFLDLAYRIRSRTVRGVTLMTPGPDSLANWLKARVGSARRVASIICATQLTLSLLTLVAIEAGGVVWAVVVSGSFGVGIAIATLLEPVGERPDRLANAVK